MNRNVTIAALVIALAIGIFTYSNTKNSAPCSGCNVLVIGVDTLRADHVHAFGYERDTTPTLDSLAAKGYAFTNAIAPASWTVPSFMSVMTGVYPTIHGVVNKYVVFNKSEQQLTNLKEISPSIETLAEAMKSAGYVTGGFTGDAGVSGAFGYKQGFDAYTDEKTFGGFENSSKHALEWLDNQKGKKFFMFFHGYDLHGQFAPSTTTPHRYVDANYRGVYNGSPKQEAILREQELVSPLWMTDADAKFWMATYDEKVRSADDQLKLFLDELQKRGVLENTLIVVVADHGEEFYEHKGIDHGHTLYDEQIHVPLMFVVPGMKGGVVIPQQVSTMDIAATLFKLTGITPSEQWQKQLKSGVDITAYFTDSQKPGNDVFSETDYRDFTHKRSVRTADGWKLIVTLQTGKEELYDLNTDPKELKNLVNENKEKAAELREKLRTHIKDDLGKDPDAKPAVGCLPVYKGECE